MDTDKEIKSVFFYDTRREICNKCEHLTTYVGVKACKICGCAIWSKTLLKGQSCPVGNWDAEQN